MYAICTFKTKSTNSKSYIETCERRFNVSLRATVARKKKHRCFEKTLPAAQFLCDRPMRSPDERSGGGGFKPHLAFKTASWPLKVLAAFCIYSGGSIGDLDFYKHLAKLLKMHTAIWILNPTHYSSHLVKRHIQQIYPLRSLRPFVGEGADMCLEKLCHRSWRSILQRLW